MGMSASFARANFPWRKIILQPSFGRGNTDNASGGSLFARMPLVVERGVLAAVSGETTAIGIHGARLLPERRILR